MERLIYDIKILKAIPSGDLIEGIEYCGGCRDFDNMGISVIGYQWNDESPKYCSSAMELLDVVVDRVGMEKSIHLVGFNSRSFDDELLKANNVESLNTTYDLLEKVRVAAGFAADYQSVPKEFSYKLDTIARANGMAKTGTGANAAILWQQGKKQQVIDYCLNDVVITSQLLDLGLEGRLIDPNTGNKLQLAPLK
jgi:hypothetical protein